MKPRASGGKPRQSGPDRPRQRDDSLGVERPLAGVKDEPTGILRVLDDVDAGLGLHARLLEVVAHCHGCLRAEQPQRRVLWGVDGHLHVVVSHAPGLPGGHQRQLVGGQGPGHPRRHDERHPLEVALVEVAQQAAEQLGVGLRRPGEHSAKRRLAAGADRD